MTECKIQYLKGFEHTLKKLDTLSQGGGIPACDFRHPGSDLYTPLLECTYLSEPKFLEDTVTRSC